MFRMGVQGLRKLYCLKVYTFYSDRGTGGASDQGYMGGIRAQQKLSFHSPSKLSTLFVTVADLKYSDEV